MPTVIAVRLHPIEPVAASAFTNFLTGLRVKALDSSFSNPDPTTFPNVAQAQYLPGNPANRIVQHVRLINAFPPPPPLPLSIATAFLPVPGGAEYDTTDLIIRVERGMKTVAERIVAYNVATTFVLSLPPPSQLIPTPVAAYVALPDPANDLGTAAAHVTLPTDGSPPQFAELRTAVTRVLQADPGGVLPDLGALTLAQCRHIANEIAWNRHTEPLPDPPRALEELYTQALLPTGQDDLEKYTQDRNRFAAQLLGDRARHESDAGRLTNAIYALAAAVRCSQISAQAQRVRLEFPVRPGQQPQPGRISESEVELHV